jgi:pilus assembly protein CpaB
VRKISPKFLLLIAAGLSIICGFLIYNYLSQNSGDAARKDTKAVVVAAMDIAPGTVLTEQMVRLELVPQKLAQPDALHSMQDAVGKRVRMSVNTGDQITNKRLKGNGSMNAFVGSIPADKRAVTLSVDDISGVAGFIRPGTHVDVITVQGEGKDKQTVGKLALQNVLVLAVGNVDMTSESEKKNENAKNVTLALDPREAVTLRVAQQEGKLTLMLRPDKPTEPEYFGATVYGNAPMRPQTAPQTVYTSQTQPPRVAAPSQNHGVTVIRGTNISR